MFGGIFSLTIRYSPNRNHKKQRNMLKERENTQDFRVVRSIDLRPLYDDFIRIFLILYNEIEVQYIQSRNLRMILAALCVLNSEKGPLSCGGRALFIEARNDPPLS